MSWRVLARSNAASDSDVDAEMTDASFMWLLIAKAIANYNAAEMIFLTGMTWR
jgi:hypothetical protein